MSRRATHDKVGGLLACVQVGISRLSGTIRAMICSKQSAYGGSTSRWSIPPIMPSHPRGTTPRSWDGVVGDSESERSTLPYSQQVAALAYACRVRCEPGIDQIGQAIGGKTNSRIFSRAVPQRLARHSREIWNICALTSVDHQEVYNPDVHRDECIVASRLGLDRSGGASYEGMAHGYSNHHPEGRLDTNIL